MRLVEYFTGGVGCVQVLHAVACLKTLNGRVAGKKKSLKTHSNYLQFFFCTFLLNIIRINQNHVQDRHRGKGLENWGR